MNGLLFGGCTAAVGKKIVTRDVVRSFTENSFAAMAKRCFPKGAESTGPESNIVLPVPPCIIIGTPKLVAMEERTEKKPANHNY